MFIPHSCEISSVPNWRVSLLIIAQRFEAVLSHWKGINNRTKKKREGCHFAFQRYRVKWMCSCVFRNVHECPNCRWFNRFNIAKMWAQVNIHNPFLFIMMWWWWLQYLTLPENEIKSMHCYWLNTKWLCLGECVRGRYVCCLRKCHQYGEWPLHNNVYSSMAWICPVLSY